MEVRRNGGAFIEGSGDGSATRAFLYVDDAAEGITLATQRYNGFRLVALGISYEISVGDVTEVMVGLAGFRGKILWTAKKPNGQTRRKLDSSRGSSVWFSGADCLRRRTSLCWAVAREDYSGCLWPSIQDVAAFLNGWAEGDVLHVSPVGREWVKVGTLARGNGVCWAEGTEIKSIVEVSDRRILRHLMRRYAPGRLSEFCVALGYGEHTTKRCYVGYYSINGRVVDTRKSGSIEVCVGRKESRTVRSTAWFGGFS